MSTRFHLVAAPVINMRKLPHESAELVSQAYFSEEIHVIEKSSDWVKIETVVDNYQGWTKADGICGRKGKNTYPSSGAVKVNRCMAHVYHVPDTIYGPIVTAPFESMLELLDHEDDGNSRWLKVVLPDLREAFVQRGDVTFNVNTISYEQIPAFSLQFLGLPYTWGGRSSFGYDCSGFVQMLYRQAGIFLPRDSNDQAKWDGFETVSFEELAAGNLIFFGLNENNIRHVGMHLKDNQFIHATVAEHAPYIHISNITDPEWNGLGKWSHRTARKLKIK